MICSRRVAALLGSLSLVVVASLLIASLGHSAPPSTSPPRGLRDKTPQVFALTNARIHIAPGKSLDRGTVVLRDGIITQVGKKVEIPTDATVIDLSGKTIYAGFIDAYSELSLEDAKAQLRGAPYWNEHVAPQLAAAQYARPSKSTNEALRSQGLTMRMVAPAGDVINGSCALLTTSDESAARSLLKDDVGLHIRLTVKRGGSRDVTPTSPMGAVALARQAFYDAAWYRDAWKVHDSGQAVPRPERNDALAALQPAVAGEQLVLADAPNEWFFLRADRFAKEFGLKLALIGSGREYRRLDEIVATGRPVIVPLNFPQPPNVASAEAALHATLTSLMHWDHAPENPARLAKSGVKFAFTTAGLKETKDFLPRLRTAVERGLSREAALAALTTTPAELFGMRDRLGTIEPGKLANLVVANGDLFAKEGRVEQVWIDGNKHDVATPSTADLRGTWEVTFQRANEPELQLQLELRGNEKLQGQLQFEKPNDEASHEITLNHVGQREARISAAFEAEKLGGSGIARLTAVAEMVPGETPTMLGQVTWADASRSELTAKRVSKDAPKSDADDEEASKDKKEGKTPAKTIDRKSSFALTYPMSGLGIDKRPEQPRRVLFTHATIWTCSEAGILKDASLLIEDGKIVEIAKEIATPEGAMVVDLKGQHLSPGIIDCHSHMATDGGINETGQAVTAEVRIGDFIDPDDVNIYRQLAGGVTTVNILHGSANPIGGQNQVCQLRWGENDEVMKFKEAPLGIKFALGENVKQSNWGEKYTSRYPQTRMGVEQLMRDEFIAAREYEQAWLKWERDHTGLPPRKDLELECVLQILKGERWIHCHSYRQDEILAFMKVTDEFQIQIGTLQHILEGYKVADAMAARGVMGSSFSDWWAYKMEVQDAVPYNGTVMHKAGVVVSFNSDDLELARHLNHEAAKARKYGGLSSEEAMKFVTLNAAKQLRIDHLVGSLEVGKSADLAVWNGSPLSTTARCEQTWIEGRRYFDREHDKALRKRDRERHTALVQKVLASGDAMLSPEELDGMEPNNWPRTDIFCGHNHLDGYWRNE